MRPCYEREWFEAATGKKDVLNHCGNHTQIDGEDFCTIDGNLMKVGYLGSCNNIKQPSLFDYGKEN